MSILFRDKEDIEKNLKRKFKGHQTEKESIMDEIEDLTEKIKLAKEKTKSSQELIRQN